MFLFGQREQIAPFPSASLTFNSPRTIIFTLFTFSLLLVIFLTFPLSLSVHPTANHHFSLHRKNSNKDQSPLCVSKTNMRSMFVVFSGCFFFCFVTEGWELTVLHWSKAFVGSRTWVHRRLVSSSGSFVYKQYRADRTLSESDSLD